MTELGSTLAGTHASPTARAAVACTHCGLDVPGAFMADGQEHQFCCDACRLVYSTIHSCGLDQYYRIRERLGAPGRRAASTHASFAEFDDPEFLRVYAAPVQHSTASEPASGRAGAGSACAPICAEPTNSAAAPVAASADPAPPALRVDLLLEGVHCAACLWLIERLPRVIEGVRSARLDLRRAVVTIEWEPAHVRLSAIAHALAGLGYRPHAITDTSAQDARRRQDRAYLIRIGVAAACSGNAMLLAFALYSGDFSSMEPVYAHAFRWLSVALGLLSLLWPGRVFLDGALAALRARMWHLDTPIAAALIIGNVASIIAAARGSNDLYVDSLSMLIFLLLVGRWLQIRQQRHALDAVELLFSLTPGVAHLVDDVAADPDAPATARDVSIQSLRPGHMVEVCPQEVFPVDGVITHGSTSVDASILTGESRPAPAVPGDAVAAGTVNLAAAVRVRTAAVGRQTRAGKMMAMIEELSRRRTPIVGSAQRLAAPFVIVVTALALLTLALHASAGLEAALGHTIALLVVTCPCAVALATPLVVTIAVGRAARQGVLIKGGDVFERLARPGTIVLDKTGTLTTGQFRVLSWHGDAALRPIVAAMEVGSTHPIAVALAGGGADLDESSRDGGLDLPDARLAPPPISDIEHILGCGVRARIGTGAAAQTIRIGSPAWIAESAHLPPWARKSAEDAADLAHTPVLISVDGQVRAAAILGDQLRPDAAEALDRLRAGGWRIALLSGDDAGVVARVAQSLRIEPEDARGGVSPEGKLRHIQTLRGDAPTVVMVGDGVNDAAALAGASVGIAVRGGAEASLAAADVYIERGGLAPIARLADASRRVLRTIRLCLGIAVAYNIIAATLAMAGLLSPLIAAALMPVSSLSVLSVAVRSRSFGKEDAR